MDLRVGSDTRVIQNRVLVICMKIDLENIEIIFYGNCNYNGDNYQFCLEL